MPFRTSVGMIRMRMSLAMFEELGRARQLLRKTARTTKLLGRRFYLCNMIVHL